MDVAFLKMDGAGNDFVVLDEREAPVALDGARVVALADRRRGIGFDQLVRLRPASAGSGADVRMVIQNADGSESGTCGNATRCVAWLATAGRSGRVAIETAGGMLSADVLADGSVEVDMGAPRLEPGAIGIANAWIDTLHLPLAGDPAGCSMGNPHATFFVGALDATDVAGRGAAVERDPLFGERANVGFAQMVSRRAMRLAVWERGAGITLACGSGACAAVVNAVRRGIAERDVSVTLPGGVLGIAWRETDGHVRMTGPVATAFSGRFTL